MSLPARPLAVAAMAFAHVPPLVFGALTPGYSAMANYISELGAAGAPYSALVSLGTFLPAGVSFVLTCVALQAHVPTRRARAALMLVALVGVSWIVAAFAPCDAGCPAEGSGLQAVHNLAGLVGYVWGGVGFLLLGAALRPAGASWRYVAATAGCGVLLVVGLVAMTAPELTAVRGLVQRVMELAAGSWILVAAWSPSHDRESGCA